MSGVNSSKANYFGIFSIRRWGKLIVCSLTTVARPSAALSGAPTIAREARRADSRNPGRMRRCCPRLHPRSPVCSSMTFASPSFMRTKYLTSSSGVPRGFYALEVTGCTQAMQAPPTPRPRGTIYEACPLFSVVFERALDGVHNLTDSIPLLMEDDRRQYLKSLDYGVVLY